MKRIKISPSVFVMGGALALSRDVALAKLCTVLAAALIHELGHAVAALALKIKIKRLKIDIFGAMMETDPLLCSYQKEAVLCLAGPLSNIISAALISHINLPVDRGLFTAASLAFAAINLLPAKHFDGGRAIYCMLAWKLPTHSASAVIEVSSFLSVFLLWTVSVYFIMKTGAYLSLFVFSGALFARLFCSSTSPT